jgi:predicted transcriptional regulator
MQDQPNAAVQRAVVGLVLDAHPKSLTIPELAREVGGEAVERAVRDLVAVGLLERRDDAVSASAALIHLDGLELP